MIKYSVVLRDVWEALDSLKPTRVSTLPTDALGNEETMMQGVVSHWEMEGNTLHVVCEPITPHYIPYRFIGIMEFAGDSPSIFRLNIYDGFIIDMEVGLKTVRFSTPDGTLIFY